MKNLKMKLVWNFPVSPEALSTALTDARHIKRWSGEKGRVKLLVGGAVELFGGWVKGSALALVPGRQLSFTWKPAEWSKGTSASIVTFRINKSAAGAHLTVLHADFPDTREMESHRDGWRQFVFEPLEAYLSR